MIILSTYTGFKLKKKKRISCFTEIRFPIEKFTSVNVVISNNRNISEQKMITQMKREFWTISAFLQKKVNFKNIHTYKNIHFNRSSLGCLYLAQNNLHFSYFKKRKKRFPS